MGGMPRGRRGSVAEGILTRTVGTSAYIVRAGSAFAVSGLAPVGGQADRAALANTARAVGNLFWSV